MTECADGFCTVCQKTLKPGEEFSVTDTRSNKRVNVLCIENDAAEFVFQIKDESHPENGTVIRFSKKQWVN